MSHAILRLALLGRFLLVPATLFAQTREKTNKPASRPEQTDGNIASDEEIDFTRFRVVTDEGILVVFDADEDWDGRDEPASQLAYWHDFASEQLFFFDRLLFDSDDVLQSIATMQRDLAIDPALLLLEKPELDPLPEITSPGLWRPALDKIQNVLGYAGALQMKDDIANGLMAFLLVGSTLNVPANAQNPPALVSMVDSLKQADVTVFTLEVEVEAAVSVLSGGQGNAKFIYRITAGDEGTAIVWKATELPKPKFYAVNTLGYQAVDYDSDGNLILSMQSEGATFRNLDVHEDYTEYVGFRVAPNDTSSLMHDPSITLDLHRPLEFNTHGFGMLRLIRWTLGRPPVDDLRELVNQTMKADGTSELTMKGRYSQYSGEGVWKLVVDPSDGILIRNASFSTGGDKVLREYTTEGSRRFGNIVFAAQGRYTSSRQNVNVRLISFQPAFDPVVAADAKNMIARAQTMIVRVIDHRQDPRNPKAHLVPAGDLNKIR